MAIQMDYLRFSSEAGSSLRLRNLLSEGSGAWPEAWQRRYPALTKWQGIEALKMRLSEIVGAARSSSVLLANRPHALMLLCAHLLVRSSPCILTTDLGWLPFQAILYEVAKKYERRIVRVRLRRLIRGGGDASAATEALTWAYQLSQATALFLPAISHDGIQLPVRHITNELKKVRELRFVAIDGAQHLAHGVTTYCEMDCDFYLAGTHKWLRSLYPLGVAVFGHPRSKEQVETAKAELCRLGILTDPLIHFASQLEGKACDEVTETMNLSGLLSACGGALDAVPPAARKTHFQTQLKNAADVCEGTESEGWRPLHLASDLRSGIQLLRPPVESGANLKCLQRHFERKELIATTYPTGIVRLSLPGRPLQSDVLERIHRAFCLPVSAKV